MKPEDIAEYAKKEKSLTRDFGNSYFYGAINQYLEFLAKDMEKNPQRTQKHTGQVIADYLRENKLP